MLRNNIILPIITHKTLESLEMRFAVFTVAIANAMLALLIALAITLSKSLISFDERLSKLFSPLTAFTFDLRQPKLISQSAADWRHCKSSRPI